jgi:hypothetical protein
MAQTHLKASDDFCGINQESAPFYYSFQPDQYQNTYVVGEVGVIPQGGGPGSYVRADVIDISSFLSGRNDILTKCNPPVPSLESLNKVDIKENFTDNVESYVSTLETQNKDITNILIPKYTRGVGSEKDISAVDYNRWQTLYTDAQNPRYILEDMSATRGGASTQQFVKNAWRNQNQIPNFDENLCKINLDPSRFCEGCDYINGSSPNLRNQPRGKPPGQPKYPFVDITSQQIFGTTFKGGNEFFFGPKLEKGSIPKIPMLDFKSQKQLDPMF